MEKQMETERLVVRRFRETDWEDLYEYLSDERVVEYEPYPPLTKMQCRQAAASRMESDDFWAVCLKVDGKMIGNVYLAGRDQKNWEVGYVFNHIYQKQGYATEAVVALISDIFCNQNAHRVYAECNPENVSSWRLLERVGFHREAHLRKNVYFNCSGDGTPLWQDTYIYGLLEDEWQSEI